MKLARRRLAVVIAAGNVTVAGTASPATADGIEPGLWTITVRTESNGMVGPPHQSSKCLNAEQARDVAVTFSPIARMINSECAPIERTLDGTKLNWRLVCRGQLNVDLTGAFIFDSPRHYSATVHSQAMTAGLTMETRDAIEGQWAAACQ